MSEVLSYWPELLTGVAVTVRVAVLSIVFSAAVALILGSLRASPRLLPRRASGVTIEMLRGATVLIYLFWLFYALPLIPGAPQLSPLAASVIVISMTAGSYGAEAVRAGLASIPAAQHDAVHALGLARTTALFRVVIPQALSQIVPAFGSVAVDIVKWTSIVSFVGVQDLLYVANSIRAATNESVPTYTLMALIYIVLCVVVAGIFRVLEYLLPMERAKRTSVSGPQRAREQVTS